MRIDEKARSGLADRIPAAVIFAYPKRSQDSAEPGAGEVIGVLTRPAPAETGIGRQLIHSDTHSEQFLWTGFALSLHKDDAESYYFNLMGDKPSVSVVS